MDVNAESHQEMNLLQQTRHANIVLFLGGGITSTGAPFLVTELVECGTLNIHSIGSKHVFRVLIPNHAFTGNLLDYLAKNKNIIMLQKYNFARDTAAGMAHLHSLGHLHRDLKSANLLVL